MSNEVVPLGRLTPVPPREVWRHEAQHFTPWLLKNVDVLNDLLGMELVLERAEHPVGDFSLDLIGRDETTGDVVIVENQLEVSDHTHLGQILTYAAGTDPATVIWVAARFRPEHRAALDWLNSRTDEKTRFFGIELGVVRLGASEPAPSFRLVAQPNDWEKTVRLTVEPTGKPLLYSGFWSLFIERINREHPSWSRALRPPTASWLSLPTGVSDAVHTVYFTRRGLSSELYFGASDSDLNTARFETLSVVRDEIEDAYGATLDWQAMPGRKATRIAEYLPGADVAREQDWPGYLDWLIDRQGRLRRAVEMVGGVPRTQ